jgi:hypothetical protein
MASFEQHVNGAVIASGLAVIPLYSASIVDINQTLALFSLGILGGVLPDVDSDNSKPIQISFRILSIFLPLIAILTTVNISAISNILLMWVIYSLVLHFGVFQLFLASTHHRGIFHSIPMGGLMALLLLYLFHEILGFDSGFSILSGIFLFFGFLIHLLLDEVVSLNLLGKDIKKSFGSAMKIYDKNNLIGTFILYAGIAGLLFVLRDMDVSIFAKLTTLLKEIKY